MKKTSSSSRIMTQSILQNWQQNGLKTMISMFYHGQHSPQTSIQLNISGNYSKDYLQPMKILHRGYLSFGRELQQSGGRLVRRNVKN
jgi:hypothetical protein